MVERTMKDRWTLNEEPSWSDLELGMINIEDLREDVAKKVIPRPFRKHIDIPHEDRFDHTDQGQWWVTKKKPAPRTDAMDRWLVNQQKRGSGMRALVMVIIMLAILVAAGSFFAAQAHAGMAFLRFEVVSVSDDLITVKDEHGDCFDFYKEGSPEVHVGQEVIVATDLQYKGHNEWVMNRGRTAIIDTVN
jgi:hypothetical protein